MSDDGRIEERGAAGSLPPTDEEISPEARAAILRLVAEIDRLRAEITANNRRIAHLEEVADRDPLTPTVNRRAFVRELERTKAYVDRYKAPAAIIYFDIDEMKTINDRYGHAVGDEVLVTVARTLMGNVRSSDIVGRLGGDEFGIILSHRLCAARTTRKRSRWRWRDCSRRAPICCWWSAHRPCWTAAMSDPRASCVLVARSCISACPSIREI